MPNTKYPLIRITLLALLVLLAESKGSCGAGACWGGRRGSHLYYPRRTRGYDYHRRHRGDAVGLVSDILSIPFYATNSLLRQSYDQLTRLEQNAAPRYAMMESEDGTTVELTMEVPGVAAKDIIIEVEDENVLRIHGSRTIRENGSVVESRFDQAFQLERDIDIEKISVTLDSGILTITAPKKEKVVKRIPLQVKELSKKDKLGSVPVEKKTRKSRRDSSKQPSMDTRKPLEIVDSDDSLEISEEEDSW